jgi:RHS repeat-associated protein
MINQFVQSMIVSSLWTCEGNHTTSIVHCDAVPTGYLGMDFDPETLLYIEGGRPYDPAAGRYLTAGSMAAGTYNIYAFANNTPVDRSVRDVRGAGMQGIVGGSPTAAGTQAALGSMGKSVYRFGNGIAQLGANVVDTFGIGADAVSTLFGYNLGYEAIGLVGQQVEAGELGTLDLLSNLGSALVTSAADTVTLGGYATYQYSAGVIDAEQYGDRMIGMGLSLLGGVGTLRAAGLGSMTVGQATQVALRTAQTTARAAGRALSQIELNPAALTQFNSGIPLNLLRWKQTGNPLAKIAEGFGTAAERVAPSNAAKISPILSQQKELAQLVIGNAVFDRHSPHRAFQPSRL